MRGYASIQAGRPNSRSSNGHGPFVPDHAHPWTVQGTAVDLSSLLALMALALSAALAARRERAFLAASIVALLAAIDLLARGADGFGFGRLALLLIVTAAGVSAAEAFGLPGPLARRTRLGIHDREREFDRRLSTAVGSFGASLYDPHLGEPGRRRDRALRAAQRLVEQLQAADPPSPEWARVRDGFVGAVSAVAAMLSRQDRVSPLATWQAATAEPLQRRAPLRDRYVLVAPPGPPWAALVVAVAIVVSSVPALDLVDRAYEPLVAPAVAAGWQPMALPFARGDSWGGNAVTDGRMLFLATRENVQGFWGVIRVRSSADGGRTWSTAGAASLDATSTTARPALALAPDGSLWVAFARQGSAVATQLLQIGRSTDGGTTWPMLARASPPSIGLIGLPALLVTADVRLVAYTDGATGAAIVQPIGPDGSRRGPATTLGRTTRELYTDAPFLDAGFAMAAHGRRVVALWHSSDQRLEVAVSDDAGSTWRPGPVLATDASWARPQLIGVGAAFVALVGRASATAAWLELDRSADGGATWTAGPRVSSGFASGGGTLARSNGGWMLAYPACSGFVACVVRPRVWYRTSVDGQAWSDPEALTPAGAYSVIGVGATSGRPWVIWEHDLSTSDEDRAVEGVAR